MRCQLEESIRYTLTHTHIHLHIQHILTHTHSHAHTHTEMCPRTSKGVLAVPQILLRLREHKWHLPLAPWGEGRLEQAQGTVLRIFLFSLPLSLSSLPPLLLPVTSLPSPSQHFLLHPLLCCLSLPTLHSITDMIWWCVYRSRVHGEATTFGSMYLTTTPRRDTWRACSKRTALSGTATLLKRLPTSAQKITCRCFD